MFRVLSYNILEGGGTDRFSAVLEVVAAAGAEIVCLQECNGWHADGQRLLREASGRLGLAGYLAQSQSDYHLAVLTNFVVDRFVVRRDGWNHCFAELEVRLPGGEPLHLFNAHLDPFSESTRLVELGRLLSAMSPHHGDLALLVGDLNSMAPGDTFRGSPVETAHETVPNLTMPIEIQVQPRLRETGWIDCYRHLHPDGGLTFRADGPYCRLDYAYASPALAAQLTACEVVDHPLVATASDHRPLVARFERA